MNPNTAQQQQFRPLAQSRMVMCEDAKQVGKTIIGAGQIAARHNGPVAFGLIAIYGNPGDSKADLLSRIEAALPKVEALDDPPTTNTTQEVLPNV